MGGAHPLRAERARMLALWCPVQGKGCVWKSPHYGVIYWCFANADVFFQGTSVTSGNAISP